MTTSTRSTTCSAAIPMPTGLKPTGQRWKGWCSTSPSSTSFPRRCRSRSCSCRWTRRCAKRKHVPFQRNGTCSRAWYPISYSAAARGALLAPLEKLKKQGFPLLIGGPPHACAVQERLEVRASRCLAADKLCQLFFGRRQPGPTRDRRGEIDVAPLRLVRRLPQLLPILEQLGDEALDLAVPIALFRPIVGSQHERHGKRVDGLSLWNQVRVVLVRQLPYGVKVGEHFFVRDR